MRYAVVFLAALAVFLPHNGYIPITDPVEGNYALTAKEMLVSGDWLSPRIYGQFWYDKPALIYWLIAASYKVFGVGEFAARFPSAIFGAASISFVCWFADRLYGGRLAGLFAALALGTSLEVWVLARMVVTDAVLLFFSSVTLAAFYLGLKGQGRGWHVVAYAAAGLAVLTKGPVGAVLPALIVFVYIAVTRQWTLLGRLHAFLGAAVFLAVAGPWYLAMYSVHGRDFVDTFLGLHNYIRATISEHPKDNVFYYYLILFPVSLLPWTGVFLRSLAGRRGPHFAYLAAWVGVTIVFYTLMATKYPTYVFPALFPAAVLVGRQLTEMQTARPRAFLWLSLPAAILLAAFAAGGALLPEVAWRPLQLAAAVGAALIVWLGYRGKQLLQPLAVGAAVIAVSLLFVYECVPTLAASRSARDAAAVLPPRGAAVAAIGEYPTSAVFYSGYLITRLEDKQEASGDVWSGKYTMPVETSSVFTARTAEEPETYLIVAHGYEPLPEFTEAAVSGGHTVYKKAGRR